MNFSDIENWVIPEGVVNKVTDSLGRVIWQNQTPPPTAEYFYVEDISGSPNTLTIKKPKSGAPTITVYKSSDSINWERMGNTSTTAIRATVPANDKLYLKAVANAWATSETSCNYISCSGNFNVGGNIMSLLYGDTFNVQSEFPSNAGYTFTRLFSNNTNLVNASNLLLPATTLYRYCYQYMFNGCTHLTTAPALPATTLVESCYQRMFYGCTSLTTAPALPATTLANNCYKQMFWGCTSLTSAPALPATTLAANCYQDMFYGCTSLTTAPALPATTLAQNCYYQMFRGCTHLTSVITYANDISASNCLSNWLNNVSPTGDFYNLGGATYTSGASGIPSGWTEHKTL